MLFNDGKKIESSNHIIPPLIALHTKQTVGKGITLQNHSGDNDIML